LFYLAIATLLPLWTVAAADGTPDLKEPKPILRARWSADWSVLRDEAPLTSDDSWRPYKFIPLNKSGDTYLSFGGEYRFAYEVYDQADMGTSDIGRQDAVQHRGAVHADLHLNQKLRFFFQLGYAIDETDVDIWQMFADYRFVVDESTRVNLRLGRQIIETANVFITAGEAHNIRLYYDGLRLVWINSDFVRFDAFAAEYVDYADGTFDMSGTDEYFWGLRFGMRFQEPEIDLNFYYMGWDLLDRQVEQGGAGRHDELRHTFLAWLNRPLIGERQWGLDYYLAYQFGEYEDRPGDSDIRAIAAFGESRYAFYPQAHTPIVGLKTSYFSGDDDPQDSELNTFYDPVFGTPYFGYARDIMPFNLVQIQPNIGYRFGEQVIVTLNHEFLWRVSTDDAYYNSANGITVRAGVSDSHQLGQQTQLALRYKPIDNIIISSYLSHFYAGNVIDDAGGDDSDNFYFDINFLF